MMAYIEYLKLPATIVVILIGALLCMQFVGEFLEFKGKIVPEIFKIRKYILRKRREKKEEKEAWKKVSALLSDFNSHYSADNIAKRDAWMNWVNNQATVYDNSISKLANTLSDVVDALKANTRMTEEMFVQGSRDRIIDFASKAIDESAIVSREEFNRIFKVYKKYEDFLEEHKMTNGEVDTAYRIIQDAYTAHMKNHTFLENIRGYDN